MSHPPTYADVGLVLAAAGSASRFGGGRQKVLENVTGKPLFLHVLERFLEILSPAACVIVCDAPGLTDFQRRIAMLPRGGDIRVVLGGATRSASVLRGLEALEGLGLAWVAIQDAARPLSSLDLLERCIASARIHGSGVAAHPVTDTIKVTDGHGRVVQTPDRETLWAAETPQVFALRELMAAYRAALADSRQPTDDAGAFEQAGHTVHLVPSLTPNPKVTYQADLLTVRHLLNPDSTSC